MENPIIVPFDLNTAKKINIGEITGRIVTEKGQNRAEIVYEDLQGKLWTILMDCLISMNVPMERCGIVAFLLRAMNIF